MQPSPRPMTCAAAQSICRRIKRDQRTSAIYFAFPYRCPRAVANKAGRLFKNHYVPTTVCVLINLEVEPIGALSVRRRLTLHNSQRPPLGVAWRSRHGRPFPAPSRPTPRA
ncbi:hypothetical protein EVAR_102714_1 [Eumeta japonica]|uniref:Uncharacterized protein n=1 Tax=Eumeta variegata TaxID=151549 RepID=A0A4C1THN0_EUMVA|nr:hypothetical protein EVAR_102714_1 [Eumeta japonica]